MTLSSIQVKALREALRAEGWTLTVRREMGEAYGSVRPSSRAMMLVNNDEGVHSYTDAEGKKTTIRQHDPRKTLAHEYTHILQSRAGHYRGLRGDHIKECYNYNEVIANTIGMLCYPTPENIIDNAGYVNRYIKKGTGDLMQYLEADIEKFLPEVRAFLEKTGLL